MADIENSPFYSIFEQFTSKSKRVIWKNWDEEGIVELDNVAIYDKLSKNAQNLTVKNSNQVQKNGGGICPRFKYMSFICQRQKLFTSLNRNSTFTLKINFMKAWKPI